MGETAMRILFSPDPPLAEDALEPVGPASRKPEALANRRIEQRPPRPAGAAQAERRGKLLLPEM
jgi:hypothetical protein